MAEELVLDVKTNIQAATKDTADFGKSVDNLERKLLTITDTLEKQTLVLTNLQDEQSKLKKWEPLLSDSSKKEYAELTSEIEKQKTAIEQTTIAREKSIQDIKSLKLAIEGNTKSRQKLRAENKAGGEEEKKLIQDNIAYEKSIQKVDERLISLTKLLEKQREEVVKLEGAQSKLTQSESLIPSGAEKDFKDLTAEIAKQEKVIKDLTKAKDDAAKILKQQKTNIKEETNVLGKSTDEVVIATKQLKEYEKILEGVEDKIHKFADSLKAQEKILVKLQKAQEAMKPMEAFFTDRAKGEYKKLTEDIKSQRKVIKETTEQYDESRKELKRLNEENRKLEEHTEELIEKQKQQQKATQNTTKAQEDYNKTVGDTEGELKSVSKQLEEQKDILVEMEIEQVQLLEAQAKMSDWENHLARTTEKLEKSKIAIRDQRLGIKKLTLEQQKQKAATKGLTDAQKEQDKAVKDSIGGFNLFGVSLNGIKKAFKGIIPTAKAMFGSIKAGLISTGIGAFVILLGSVVTYFTSSKEGARKLEKILAGLGAVLKVLRDRFATLGGTIVSVFEDPKQAVSDLWDAIKTNLINRVKGLVDTFEAAGKVIKSVLNLDWDGVTEGAKEYGQALIQVGTGLDVEQQKKFADSINNVGKSIKNMTAEMREEKAVIEALIDRTHALEDAEKKFIVQRAITRKAVAQAKLDAQDETKTAQERLDALQAALDMEKSTTDQELRLAKEKLAIQRENMATSTNLKEDEQKLAEFTAKVYDLETKSLLQQKRIKTEMNGLENELFAEKKARLEEEQRLLQEIMDIEMDRLNNQIITAAALLDAHYQKQLDAQTRERNAVTDKWFAIIEAEEVGSEMRIELEKAYNEELDAVDKKYSKTKERSIKQLSENEVKWAEMTADEKLSIASNTAGDLAQILGEETAAGKAAAIIQATINTYKAAQASYASLAGIPVVGPVLGGIAAAAAVASGIKNVQAIASAGGGGGGGGGLTDNTTVPDASAEPPAPQMMSGDFNIGGLEAPEPIKAFVVTDEMTSSQNQLADIRRRATI